jgi:hypothetical protein
MSSWVKHKTKFWTSKIQYSDSTFEDRDTDPYLFTTLFPNGVLLRHIKPVKGQ